MNKTIYLVYDFHSYDEFEYHYDQENHKAFTSLEKANEYVKELANEIYKSEGYVNVPVREEIDEEDGRLDIAWTSDLDGTRGVSIEFIELED